MEDFKPYTGSLTIPQILTARKKILLNAESLIEEANILLNHNKHERAYFLLCIANEELGKIFMLTSAIVDVISENINWKSFWKKFRNHKRKISVMEHMDNLFTLDDAYFQNPKDIEKNISLLDGYKMLSLYSDIVINDFYQPSEVVPVNYTEQLLIITQARIHIVRQTLPYKEGNINFSKEDIINFKEKFGYIENS